MFILFNFNDAFNFPGFNVLASFFQTVGIDCCQAINLMMQALHASEVTKVAGKILCCECGTPIDPNPANLCVACLRTQVDITEGIPKQVSNLKVLW